MFNSHSEMVNKLAKPGSEIIPTLTNQRIECLHMAIGIAGEAAEVLACIMAFVEEDEIFEEIGDVEFYVEGLCQNLDIENFDYRFSTEQEPDFPITSATKLSLICGGLLDEIKKHVFYDRPPKMDNIILAISDIVRHLTYLCEFFDFDRKMVKQGNIQKLSARYSTGKFSDEQAKERADKQEPHHPV